MNEKILAKFIVKGATNDEAFVKAETELGWPLPSDYKEFLKKNNGGEGFIGENYLILWSIEELAQFNKEYQIEEYAPGLILFGSDGGGEGFAFDRRTLPATIVQVPFIGMELNYARLMAANFDEFLAKLAAC
jgi:cell wall assembly regulator SMI1